MNEQRTRGRPPKGEEAQTARIYMRAAPAEKSRYELAAEKAGLSLTEWIKDRLDRAVKREIGQ